MFKTSYSRLGWVYKGLPESLWQCWRDFLYDCCAYCDQTDSIKVVGKEYWKWCSDISDTPNTQVQLQNKLIIRLPVTSTEIYAYDQGAFSICVLIAWNTYYRNKCHPPHVTLLLNTKLPSRHITDKHSALEVYCINLLSTQCSTGCSIMIAPPSTAKTNKTLAKLFLYYSSLNKITLLCKVSDWCVWYGMV